MVNLTKGQKISLAKEAPGLNRVIVGLGWDVNKKQGFFGLGGHDFDLDAFIVGCRNGHYSNRHDLVYFGNKDGCDGAIHHCGDNLTGAGDGDDEQIIVNLNNVPADVDKLVIAVNIYQAKHRKQDFGQVENAFVRLVNADTNQEVLRYDLSENYSGYVGMIFGELYRHNGEWKFAAQGNGVKEATVEDIAGLYR